MLPVLPSKGLDKEPRDQRKPPQRRPREMEDRKYLAGREVRIPIEQANEGKKVLYRPVRGLFIDVENGAFWD